MPDAFEGSLKVREDEEKLIVGTSSGDMAIYNWDWFGDCKDRLVGHPEGVEKLVKFDESYVLTGGEDGWVRIVGVYPHSINLFKRHAEDLEDAFAISGMSMSHDKKILATISHDCSINFFDLTEIGEKIEEVDLGEKLEMDEEKGIQTIKHEMSQKVKNKEKQEKRLNEKKNKMDFFGDI